jgi:hypothetical protein
MVVRPLPSNLPLRTAKLSNRRRRWHASLANKGLAAFRPALVTLSLGCLRQTSPEDWDTFITKPTQRQRPGVR